MPIMLALLAALSCSPVQDSTPVNQQEYEPTWESLATRETPQWFKDAKFGIFIHWGVYSVPAFCDTSTYSEWYQWWYDTNSHGGKVRDFHHANYGEDFEYQEFAPMFRAEMWDPKEWAEIFRRSGARYMVITSKHHDGFCLWPNAIASEVRGYPWNSMETGPKRDLLSELFEACRNEGVRPGLYYSFMEWHSPLYDDDKERYVAEVMIPQIKELVANYEPDVFWPDGEWDYPDTLWQSPEVLEWIYENSANPDIVVNDRWGKGLRGQVGDYTTTEYGNLGNSSGKGMRKERPFEECRGIGHSFAFNRAEGYDIYSSRTECVHMLIDLVSKGGSLLLDIGPTADGRIPLIMVDRLLAIGAWLDINGEAIYGTTASPFKGSLPWGRATRKGETIYLHVFEWPEDDTLEVTGLATPINRATMLGDRQPNRTLNFEGNRINLTGLHPNAHASVIKLELQGEPVVDHSIGPDEIGIVRLTADTAQISGENLRVERYNDIPNLGYWTNTTATATWEARLEPGRTYDIVIDYACEADAGGLLELSIGEQSTDYPITGSTGNRKAFEQIVLSSTVAPKKEPTVVRIRAAKLHKDWLINLRAISFVPKDK